MENYKIKKYFKISLILAIIFILIFIIFLIILKYELEGEKREDLPFYIDKISLVSTADGLQDENNREFLWKGDLLQINDIYITISKNENLQNTILENVILENFELTYPEKGNINFCRIIKNEDTSNNYIIENLNQYKFIGGESTSLEELTISNQGGNIGLRIINNDLGTYESNEEEINYDGRILNLENIKNDEIKFKIKFDILLEIFDGNRYKTNVELELPVGDILTNGVEVIEYESINNLIYKRY